MQFFHPIWKNLHLTEIFYTGTACDACDKLKVCLWFPPARPPVRAKNPDHLYSLINHCRTTANLSNHIFFESWRHQPSPDPSTNNTKYTDNDTDVDKDKDKDKDKVQIGPNMWYIFERKCLSAPQLWCGLEIIRTTVVVRIRNYPHPSNISGLVLLNNWIFKPATQLVKHGFSILNYFRYFLAWPGILSLNACVLVRISVWEGLEHPRHKKYDGRGQGGSRWIPVWEGLVHPRHRKICWEGAGGGVGEFGKVRAPQTQKKYVRGRGGREGEWVTSRGEVEKEGSGGRPW